MRLRMITWLVIVAACSTKSEPKPRAEPAVIPSAGSGSAAPPVEPAPAKAPPDAPTLKEHMSEHFAAVSELQRAIARGHLDEAKTHARWLVGHDEKLLAEWQPFVDEMRAAAKDVANAPDLPTAGGLAARLGRACSRCHEARSAVVTFVWAPVPDEAPSLQVQMKRHQWAAARLWEGLVGPSDELWTQGTSVLATAKLDTFAAAGATPRGDVAALAAKVRDLAKRATTMTDQDTRQKLYGELLSTCAGCHQLVRPNPVPGP